MPNPLLKTIEVVLGKVEGTYNSDPSPVKTADACLVFDLNVQWPNEVHDREEMDDSASPRAPIKGRHHCQITFKTFLKGSGSAGTAPDFGPFLEACRMAETVVGGTSVTYLPTTGLGDSITIYAYKDGKLYVATGCRGNVKFVFPVGKPAYAEFTFMGHAVDDQDAAVPSDPTYQSTIPEIFVNASFTINSFAGVISNLEADLANKLVIPSDANGADGYGQVLATRRSPIGSLDPEVTLVSDHDYWSEWEDGTQMALTATLGATAGNILTFTAPKVVYREYQMDDRDDILAYQFPCSFARNSGDDEISLAFT